MWWRTCGWDAVVGWKGARRRLGYRNSHRRVLIEGGVVPVLVVVVPVAILVVPVLVVVVPVAIVGTRGS